MVLGELIEDESGRIIGHRILDVQGPKVERSFTMAGKYKDVEATDIGAFWTVMRQGTQAEPIMYAEARGVITAKDGEGMATYSNLYRARNWKINRHGKSKIPRVKCFQPTIVDRISQKSASRTGRIYKNGNEATDYKRGN